MSRLWSVTDTINLWLYNSFVTSVCHCAPLYWKWVFEFLSSKRSTRNQVDFNSNRISMSTARLVYYYLFFNSLAFHLTILLHFSFVFYPFSRIFHVHSATGRWYFSAHLQRWFYDFNLSFQIGTLFIVPPTNHWYMYLNKNKYNKNRDLQAITSPALAGKWNSSLACTTFCELWISCYLN